MMYDSPRWRFPPSPCSAVLARARRRPWALFLVFRRWSAPSSIVPRTKIRFILAALFALAELTFFIFVVYMMTQVALKGPRR